MSKKFHVNPNGQVLPCFAADGNCRYGSNTPHFSSREEGEEYYASTRSEFEQPLRKTSPKKTNSPRLDPETRKAFNKARKEVERATWSRTLEPQDAKLVAKHGSDKDLMNLAKVRTYTDKEELTPAMQIAWERTADPEVKEALVANENFRYPDMDDTKADQLLADGTYEHINYQIATTPNISRGFREESMNRISGDRYLKKIAEDKEQPIGVRVKAASGPHYIRNIPQDIIEEAAKDPHTLTLQPYFTPMGQAIRYRMASDENTPSSTLSKISQEIVAREHADLASETLAAQLVQNDNLDPLDRTQLTKTSKAARGVEDYLKSEEREDIKEKLSPLDKTPQGKKVVYRFNPSDITERGLDENAVDAYVRYIKHDPLWQTTYDTKTGEYTGWID